MTLVFSASRAARAYLAAALLALLFGVHPAAQSQEQPTFRSGVQIVEVDVRVFGKDGRFLSGLERTDFEILEQGEAQQIVALYRIDEGRAVQVTERDDAPAAAPAPARLASARQSWIFTFDLNHLTPGADFDRARDAVEEFLSTGFKEGDLGGILAGTRMVNNRLTRVREELLAAVRDVKPLPDARNRLIELTRQWPRLQDEAEAIRIASEDRDALRRAVLRACSDDPDACRVAQPDLQVREKARRLQSEIQRATMETLKAMSGLAAGLARIPGPKTIVFLSDGFVVQDIETTLRNVVGQTTRAGARVYAIDVRGLGRTANPGLLDQVQSDDPAGGSGRMDIGEDGPNSLAVDTGGMMIRNENNLVRALEQVARDANRYYVLAYQPMDGVFDGKFRPIEVRVRRPDVRVRARRGYLALEPSRVLGPQPGSTREKPNEVSSGGLAAPPPRALTPDALPPAVAQAELGPLGKPSAVSRGSAGVAQLIEQDADADETPMRLAPSALTARAREGWATYAMGDVERARALLEEAATDDAPPWVHYALGLSEFALQDFARARDAWEHVRRRVPDFKSVYFDLADAHIQLGAYGEAIAVLRHAAARWPADAEILNALGVVLARRDALDEAVASFRNAVAIAPHDALGHFNLARALELRYTKTLRYFAAAGRWVGRDSDRTEAIAEYLRYLELGGPQDATARESLARLEWKR